jgi:hypothetical protein
MSSGLWSAEMNLLLLTGLLGRYTMDIWRVLCIICWFFGKIRFCEVVYRTLSYRYIVTRRLFATIMGKFENFGFQKLEIIKLLDFLYP